MTEGVSRTEAARRAGVTAQTLRRWEQEGLVPQARDAGWTPAAIAQARVVARLRDRGHTVAEIREATDSGRLAFVFAEELLPSREGSHTVADAARQTGLEPALIERIYLSLGFNAASVDRLSDDDLELLRDIAVVLAAGFPFVALLQLVRVYGQALAQMADAEVRLFHLYVHEPLMRDGVPGVQMAEEMQALAGELLPLASPIMDRVHQRFLAHFADLAGYTRLTEEAGEEEAVDAVERFIEDVEVTLPDDARVVKTIGDEVMVVASDPSGPVDWAVALQRMVADRRPLPRIGIHYGLTLYRDGDYYGREVNLAARVAARAAGGEVVVTSAVVAAAETHLEFERIGEVRLKGFTEATELYAARAGDVDG